MDYDNFDTEMQRQSLEIRLGQYEERHFSVTVDLIINRAASPNSPDVAKLKRESAQLEKAIAKTKELLAAMPEPEPEPEVPQLELVEDEDALSEMDDDEPSGLALTPPLA